MLSVKQISASYGHVQALSGVSLEVPEKGTVTLIGSNGAGKSTLLKVISGLLKPSRGTIEFGGERIEGLPPDRIVALGIAHCPEGRRLFPELTVFENTYVHHVPPGLKSTSHEFLVRAPSYATPDPQLPLRVRARDVSGIMSAVEQITLDLRDGTAPSVQLTSLAGGFVFNLPGVDVF